MQLLHPGVMGLRTFFVLSFVFLLVHGTCPPDNVIDFVAVPEEDYDRNYSSITSTNKRPYGFDKSILYFNRPDRENPCFKVSGAGGRRLEIMFETVPKSRLCVKTQASSPMCRLGTLRWCVNAPANDTYIEFLCDSQCGEQDVSFWYRMVLGDLSSEDREDQWCDKREDEFPINLRRLPIDFPIPEATTKSPNSALPLGLSVYMRFLLALVCILVGAASQC